MDQLPAEYSDLPGSVEEQIRRSRMKAAVAVNTELIELHWRVGRMLSSRFIEEGWGAKIVNRLASDLEGALPGMRGPSARNLRYVRGLAAAYPDKQMLQQLVTESPRGHHCALIDQVKDAPARLWCIAKNIELGRSRAVPVLRTAMARRRKRFGMSGADQMETAAEPCGALKTRLETPDSRRVSAGGQHCAIRALVISLDHYSEVQPMIMRIFQVSTHPGKEAAFGDFFHNTAIPLMKRTPGLVSVTAGAPRAESPTEFCMVMIWKDLESLKAFAGEDYESAHIHPDEAELVRERRIAHYQPVEV